MRCTKANVDWERPRRATESEQEAEQHKHVTQRAHNVSLNALASTMCMKELGKVFKSVRNRLDA